MPGLWRVFGDLGRTGLGGLGTSGSWSSRNPVCASAPRETVLLTAETPRFFPFGAFQRLVTSLQGLLPCPRADFHALEVASLPKRGVAQHARGSAEVHSQLPRQKLHLPQSPLQRELIASKCEKASCIGLSLPDVEGGNPESKSLNGEISSNVIRSYAH